MSELRQMAVVPMSEMMSCSPLPWPATPYEEGEDDRDIISKEECVAYDAKQYEMYGDDADRVMDLMCDENEVDLRHALWRAGKGEEIQVAVDKFFKLVNEGCFKQARDVGSWLLQQNDEYDVCYTPALLLLLKQTIEKVSAENFSGKFAGKDRVEVACF
jgi:hypothetical protein